MASSKRNLQPCSSCRSSRRKCESTGYSVRCTRCTELDLICTPALAPNHDPRKSARIKAKPAKHASIPSPPMPDAQTPSSHVLIASQSTTSYEWTQLLEDDYRILIGFDIGTKFSSVCWQRLPRGATLTPGQTIETRNIRVEGEHRIPTEAAIVQDDDTNEARMVFGPAVEEHLRLGMVEVKGVFRLLKLSLMPEHGDEFSEDVLMMKEVGATHDIALKSVPLGDLTIECDFDNTQRSCHVSHVSHVFREYLRYLWDKVKLDIQQVSNLSNEDLQRVLSSAKTAVSVAVPAIWTNPMIDQFRKLLATAGLPNVHIVSEPKCAAAVVALEEQRRLIETHTIEDRDEALERLRKIKKIILDMGHGTADLTTCRIRDITPKLRIDTLFMGTGSLWGAQRLNDLFKEMVKYLLGNHLQDVLERLGGNDASEDVLLGPLARGFEKAKRGFSVGSTGDVKIRFDSDLALPKIPGVPFGPKWITLTATEMASIFDEYIPHIKVLIDNQVEQIIKAGLGQDDVVEVVAVGGGSLSPYIMSKLQEAYPESKVSGQESTNFSMVAKGAFLASVDPMLGRREFARTSYGTALNIRYDPEKHDPADAVEGDASCDWALEVRNRVFWMMRKGENVVEPKKPLLVDGHIYIMEEDIKWPIEIEQVIFKSVDDAVCMEDGLDFTKHPSIHVAGVLHKALDESEVRFKIHRQASCRFLEIAFRAIPRWDGMQMFWKLVIPRSGSFASGEVTDFTHCIEEEMVLEDVLKYEDMDMNE